MRLVGGLMVAETPRQLRSLERKARIEREAGIETHILGANEVREMAPYLSPTVVGAEFCPGEGKMNALAALPAIAKAAEAAGARLLRGCRARGHRATGPRHDGAHEPRSDPLRPAGQRHRTLGGPCRCHGRRIAAGGPEGRAKPCQRAGGADDPPSGLSLPGNPDPEAAQCRQPRDRRRLAGTAVGRRHLSLGAAGEHGREHVDRLQGGAGGCAPSPAACLGRKSTCAPTVVPVLGPLPGLPAFYNAVPPDAGWTAGPLCARLTAEMLTGRAPSLDVSAVAWTG